MSKKLIINESEKKHIKNLYGLSDQKEVSSFLLDFIKQSLGKSFDKSKKDSDEKTDSSSSDLGKISAKGQELLNNPTFKEKLKEISKSINIDENSIIKLMKHESGLDPKVKNSIGCVGLIQFCPDTKRGSTKTINGKSYSLEEMRNNLDLQMEAIKEFWTSGYNSGKIKSAEDLYIYNFFPIAAGKSNDFVLQAKGLSANKVARANPIFNTKLGKSPDTPLTVGGLKDYYRKTGMV